MEQKKEEGSKNNMKVVGGGVAIHSQVMKIKQETEKMKQPEIRQVAHGIPRQRPRSPLGLAERDRATVCSSVGVFRNNYRV
ncbi:hypothetical protein Patl1_15522 [Pistacia atlantica]|uniref:Uncharacterized protein n=1 Tax=Pistacia atlantica TaxID=434234 RepID=A0ACC1BBA9_9ROSI|nr:hypothetical protein Patl1_15522 [Pistacia atlantica]